MPRLSHPVTNRMTLHGVGGQPDPIHTAVRVSTPGHPRSGPRESNPPGGLGRTAPEPIGQAREKLFSLGLHLFPGSEDSTHARQDVILQENLDDQRVAHPGVDPGLPG